MSSHMCLHSNRRRMRHKRITPWWYNSAHGRCRGPHYLSEPAVDDISKLLRAWSDGDQSALERLTPIVYDELHRLAQLYMKRERPGHSLQTTALVNEACLSSPSLRSLRGN